MNAAESNAPRTWPGKGGGNKHRVDIVPAPTMGERLSIILNADLSAVPGGVGVSLLKAPLVSALNRTWKSHEGVDKDSDINIAADHRIGVASVRRARDVLVQFGVVRIVARHPDGIVHWAVNYRQLTALQRRKPEATALPQSADPRKQQRNESQPPPPTAPDAPRSGVGVGAGDSHWLPLVRRERSDPPAPLRLADAAGLAALLALRPLASKVRVVTARCSDDEIGAVARKASKKAGVQDPAAWAVSVLERGAGAGVLAEELAAEAARSARASVAAAGASGGDGPSLTARGAADRATLAAAANADPTAAWIADPANAAAVAALLAEYREQPLRPGAGMPDAKVTGSGMFRASASSRIAALQGVSA